MTPRLKTLKNPFPAACESTPAIKTLGRYHKSRKSQKFIEKLASNLRFQQRMARLTLVEVAILWETLGWNEQGLVTGKEQGSVMSELSGIVGISFVKNEADILEPMIRHNLPFLDHLILIDNNSGDGTSDIIEALAEEFPGRITSKRDLRLGHVQTQAINEVCQAYSSHQGVVCFLPLDADEAILAGRDDFRSSLLSETRPVLLPWVTYVPTREDDLSELNPLRRISHRRNTEPYGYSKTTFPRHLVGSARLKAGNHSLEFGQDLDYARFEGLSLGHFPVRTRDQLWAKVVIGGLNARAGGRTRGEAFHWREIAERFTGDQGLSEDAFFDVAQQYAIGTSDVELVKDPFPVSPEARTLRYLVDPQYALATKLSVFAEECIDWFVPGKPMPKGQKRRPLSVRRADRTAQGEGPDVKREDRFDWRRSLVRGLGYTPVQAGKHMVHSNTVHQTISSFGRLLFSVQDRRDLVQSHHFRGEIYEPEELEIIQQNFDGGHFVDIGANVGNHTVCIGSLERTDLVTAIEPNPSALALLAQNVAQNGLWEKTKIHGLAFSDAPGKGKLTIRDSENEATAQSAPRGHGKTESTIGVVLERGDAVIASSKVDFIKIDVDGHEIACLNGLRATIGANTPPVFVEVGKSDRTAVENWFHEFGYGVSAEHGRDRQTVKLLFKPLT